MPLVKLHDHNCPKGCTELSFIESMPYKDEEGQDYSVVVWVCWECRQLFSFIKDGA
jgi:hypothetical protein